MKLTEENSGKNGVKQKIKPLHMLGYMSRAFFLRLRCWEASGGGAGDGGGGGGSADAPPAFCC